MIKPRSHTADLLKGIAILFMIQVHILELFASNSISGSSCGNLLMFLGGPPVAPVFTLILGYYIAASSNTLKQHLIRAVKIIAVGMLLNLALNLNLIISVSKGLFQIDIWQYVFGIDILQFAGLSILVIAVLKKLLEQNILIPISLIACTAFLSQFLMEYIPERTTNKYLTSPFYGSCSWSYFPLFPWLAYPLTGFVFFQLKKTIDLQVLNSYKTKVIATILFALFLILTLPKAIIVSANQEMYYHHGPLFILWTICFLAFYSFLVFELNKLLGASKISNYLKWLGKNVTLVYAIQWIITGNTATEIYKTISSPYYLISAYVIILAASSLLTYLILKVKEKSTAF